MQKKRKLLNYRLHKLTDEELCESGMERESQAEEETPKFEFKMLPKKLFFRPEEEMDIPSAPIDLYEMEQQELAERQKIVDQFGWEGIAPEDRNLSLVRDRRRDLEEAEDAIFVLGKYSEEFELIYERALALRQGINSMMGEVDTAIRDNYNFEIAELTIKKDKIYHTMDTAIIPIFMTHRKIIWTVQDEIKRAGIQFGAYTTQEEIEELNIKYPRREPFRYKTTPRGVRFLKMQEFKGRWLEDRKNEDRIYKNIKEAVKSAWNSYERALRLKGQFLVRYAQQNDFVDALGSLAEDIDRIGQASLELSERDRQTEIALASELEMPKAARLISPDKFIKMGAEAFDDLLMNAPVVYGDEDEDEGEDEEPARAIPDDGKLEPIPVDEDEFLRVKFPETERMPQSIWAKIQFAGAKNLLIKIEYTKITPPESGVTKSYIVEPYSFRIKRPRRTGRGSQYYFFGYDTTDNHIKGFIYRRIQSIEILPREYVPRWEVEFHWTD